MVDNTNNIIPDKNNIEFTYDYLKQYKKEIIVTIINNYFNEEEKINILRNKDFVNDMPTYLIELMLNNMNFKSVFNMLQNKELLNKISSLNIKLTPKDNIFISNYLDSKELIDKLNHNMLKNMLININKHDVINYFNKDYIISKLTIDDILDIAISKKINIVNEFNYISNLKKEKIIYYINKMWQNNIDYSLVDNDYVKNILFNDVDFEEVIYLYELINTKSVITVQGNNHSLESFKAIIACHKLFGINKCKEILEHNNLNKKYFCLDDFTNAFKDVDINNLNISNDLLSFIDTNIIKVLEHNYDDLVFSFGSIINNYDNSFNNISINQIDDLLFKKYISNTNIKSINKSILNKLINNSFDSNINNIVNKLSNKYDQILNADNDVIITNNKIYSFVNKEELLGFDIINNENIIQIDNKYIKVKKIDNVIYLEDLSNNLDNIINQIIDDLLNNNNVNYILLKSNKYNTGMRLSNDYILVGSNVLINKDLLQKQKIK